MSSRHFSFLSRASNSLLFVPYLDNYAINNFAQSDFAIAAFIRKGVLVNNNNNNKKLKGGGLIREGTLIGTRALNRITSLWSY